MVSRRIKMFCWKEIKLVPMEIDGQMYYRTSEACKKTGVSRATLFRWLKAGILEKCYKDRRGWRIFTEEDLKIIEGKPEESRLITLMPEGKMISTEIAEEELIKELETLRRRVAELEVLTQVHLLLKVAPVCRLK